MKILVLLAALVSAQTTQWQTRRSDIFSNQPSNCTVMQGANLTFLSCPNSFEIY
jgi:hypothetical protein